MTYEEYVTGQKAIEEFQPEDNTEEDDAVSNDNCEESGQCWLLAKLGKHLKAKEEDSASQIKDINDFMDVTTRAVSTTVAEEVTRWLTEVGLDNLALMSEKELYDLLNAQAEKVAEDAAETALEDFKASRNTDLTEVAEEDMDCVRISDVPKIYESKTRLTNFRGVCGYKYQITNINENTQFSIKFMRNGAFYAVSAVSAVLVSAIAFF